MKLNKIAALLALSSLMSLAMAGEIKPFNQQDFDKLTVLSVAPMIAMAVRMP